MSRNTPANYIGERRNIGRGSAIGTNAACAGCSRINVSVLNVALLTLVATILLYVIVPKGLLPQQDTGVIVGVTDAAKNISFKAMMERVHAVSEIVRQDPDVASVSASVGAGTVNATVNTARLYIVLKPHNQRANAEKIIERLRNATRNVEGISLFMQTAQDLQIDSRISRTQFQYILQDSMRPNSRTGRRNSCRNSANCRN